jgi:hypothetical protein
MPDWREDGETFHPVTKGEWLVQFQLVLLHELSEIFSRSKEKGE